MHGFPIPDGYYLLGGLKRENALQALAEAEEGGHGPESVLTTSGGFLIPLPLGGRVAEEVGEVEEDTTPDLPTSSWANADIEAWAEENGVALNGATTKKDMLAAIAAAADTEEEN